MHHHVFHSWVRFNSPFIIISLLLHRRIVDLSFKLWRLYWQIMIMIDGHSLCWGIYLSISIPHSGSWLSTLLSMIVNCEQERVFILILKADTTWVPLVSIYIIKAFC